MPVALSPHAGAVAPSEDQVYQEQLAEHDGIEGTQFPGAFSKYLRKGKEQRGASHSASYKFGDFTVGLLATNLERGKSCRGANAGDPYKFGDFTRGIVGFLFDSGGGASSSSRSRKSLGPDARSEESRGASSPVNRDERLQKAVTGDLRSIHDVYDLDKYSKKIGEGSFGYVIKGWSKASKEDCAVKVLFKGGLPDLIVLKREVTMLRELDHPHILQFYDAFEDRCNVYLVMELCAGGELFDQIQIQGTFPEVQASFVMQQLMRAVNYMHSNNVCHRDLKPENFLLLKKAPVLKNTLKVIDFGFARRFDPGKVMTSLLGTAEYVAPEVLGKEYTAQCDIWSAGVILFILLCGYPPFRGKSSRETFRLVRQGVPKFNPRHWSHISEEGCDLVRRMLTKEVPERITVEQVLEHVWIKATSTAANSDQLCQANSGGQHAMGELMSRFRAFQAQQTVVQTALRLIAPHVEQAEVQRLRETFVQMDTRNTGVLSISQICDGLRQSGIKEIPDHLSELMNAVGSENDGSINYAEFLEAMLVKQVYIREHLQWEAFRACDKDGDGRIGIEDVAAVIKSGDLEDMPGINIGDVEALMESGRANALGGQGIDFGEFMSLMRTASERGSKPSTLA
mmetsp:Transcript_34823/g.81313  ORF Transcript_34823/g.81313 Transcript_34823/m.81313 type:complete len:625 (-) Transcript_34823:40-1914(-)